MATDSKSDDSQQPPQVLASLRGGERKNASEFVQLEKEAQSPFDISPKAQADAEKVLMFMKKELKLTQEETCETLQRCFYQSSNFRPWCGIRYTIRPESILFKVSIETIFDTVDRFLSEQGANPRSKSDVLAKILISNNRSSIATRILGARGELAREYNGISGARVEVCNSVPGPKSACVKLLLKGCLRSILVLLMMIEDVMGLDRTAKEGFASTVVPLNECEAAIVRNDFCCVANARAGMTWVEGKQVITHVITGSAENRMRGVFFVLRALANI